MGEHAFFREKFVIDHRNLGIVNNIQLLELDIQTPEIQRIVDNDVVNEIVDYQIHYVKKHKTFNFLGVINIHYVREKRKYYLIDGQHRFQAIKQLTDKGHTNIDIFVEIVEVDNFNALKENYRMINKNTQLPEFSEEIDKSIPERVALYFKNKYPSMWSKTSRARRPHIYFSFFQESLGFLTEKMKISTSEELKKVVEDYNTILSHWDISHFPDHKTITSNIYTKCKQSGLYLGLFKYVHDDFGYKWVKKIIEHQTGEIVKCEKQKQKQKQKQSIPKKVKNDSWDTYIGKEYGIAYCISCNSTEIQQKNFIGGHIVSEKNGGTVTLNNIIPICSECNLSMGCRNMDDFIRDHYPENIVRFNRREWRTHKESNEKWLGIF